MNVIKVCILVIILLSFFITLININRSMLRMVSIYKGSKSINVLWNDIKTNIILDCDAEISLRLIKYRLDGEKYRFTNIPEEARGIASTVYDSYSDDLKRQMSAVYTPEGVTDFMSKYIVSKLLAETYDHNINLTE